MLKYFEVRGFNCSRGNRHLNQGLMDSYGEESMQLVLRQLELHEAHVPRANINVK